jgi:muramoyltetrapeptide carboxypeptidase LdcA involved in peptidoglycan recycling
LNSLDDDVFRVFHQLADTTMAKPNLMLIKPERLKPGDTVAAISLSQGLAAVMPYRYQAGKRQIEEVFGVNVVETPNALREPDWLYRNPQARADDLHWALQNPDIQAMFSTIGGEESVRILPHLHLDVIRNHPKIMMGFSDTTITLSAFARAGVVSFYGPSVLCDLAENCGIHPFVEQSVVRALFDAKPFDFKAAENWTEEFLDWEHPENQLRARNFARSEGWVWLQGESHVSGRLVGGCLDVLEFLKGTSWWIPNELWDGAIFFAETSEGAPAPWLVRQWLRNYGSQGILGRISGLLLARPMKYSSQMTQQLYSEVRRILAEFGREDMPVVANMDFGHTSPQMVVPIGCRAEIYPEAKRVAVLEAGVS